MYTLKHATGIERPIEAAYNKNSIIFPQYWKFQISCPPTAETRKTKKQA